jgi:pilus assembly protein CpaD
MNAMRPRGRCSALALILASLAMAGCVDDETAARLSDVRTHHPITYGTSPETLIVELPPSGAGLSRNQEADVYRFVERFKQESTGSLRIDAPGSAGGHLKASRALRQVQTIVEDAGIDPNAIDLQRSGGKSVNAGAITMNYDRTVAVPPECGDWSDDLGENRQRLPYNNFGCATRRNLALTVANGRDLQMPQPEKPRSSERRSATWSEYVGSGQGAAGTGAGDIGGAPTTSTR